MLEYGNLRNIAWLPEEEFTKAVTCDTDLLTDTFLPALKTAVRSNFQCFKILGVVKVRKN